MVVSKIAVQNIRSHQRLETEFSPNVTVITGPNGSGKTSILEAVYTGLRGASFKGSDTDMLRTGQPWWKIDILLNETKRTVKFDPKKPSGRKQFIIDNKTNYRLLPKNKYPVVLFEPDDLRLLQGSPSRRRQFIDRFISQLNPVYASSLRQYERSLQQRNSLLKKNVSANDQLFAWDIALARHGSYIIEQRIAFTEQINSQLSDAYLAIAGTSDEVSIHYSHTLVGDVQQKLLNELNSHLQKDLQLGSTSVGPHRHDLLFEFNQSPATSTASRGEIRTIVLALKFLEVDITEKITGQKPVVLLDDVFSELDETRQAALSNSIRDNQIIITSTHTLSKNKKFQHINLPYSS